MFIKQNKFSKHSFFMKLALVQASRVLGNTKENPAVGCVIVKNNNIISASHTSPNGRPHAEINAIKFSKMSLKNSDLYVTLEHCSHYGITPPCTNSIIKNGIKRVFFSINDPDIRSFNKCFKLFKKKKIIVKKGLNFNKKEVKSSDLYVTLEPCSNYGKTPPCVKYIIKNKIKKVFFSVKDPDIRSYNQSSHQFKKK